jgi:hypothetical protein
MPSNIGSLWSPVTGADGRVRLGPLLRGGLHHLQLLHHQSLPRLLGVSFPRPRPFFRFSCHLSIVASVCLSVSFIS